METCVLLPLSLSSLLEATVATNPDEFPMFLTPGGSGILWQRIIVLLVTSTPLLLLFFMFMPNLTLAMPLAYTSTFGLFGRLPAIIGVS